MITIENNRLYIDGTFYCYASHQISVPIDSHCHISFSHRHGRNLINIAGKYWMGDNDGSLPLPDITIGSVIGSNGMLCDASAMVKLTEYLHYKEDIGVNAKIRIK